MRACNATSLIYSGRRGGRRQSSAFTLVELLVVIAIIGVLVALLLPAIQAAREAARRAQCANNLKQVGLAVLNLEAALKIFPTGGIAPWPDIKNYSSNGRPFGPETQGLSWAFQILPYLEQGPIYGLTTTVKLQGTPVPMYFCPSRRPPQQNQANGAWLMDYAGLTTAASRGSTAGSVSFDDLLADGYGCRKMYGMWGTTSNFFNDHQPKSAAQLRTFYAGYYGVFVRTNHFVHGANGSVTTLDYGPPTTVARIEDGLSNTAIATEKRIRIDLLDEQPAWDDRGWSDGWDFDTMKIGLCPPMADDGVERPEHTDACSPGSSHASGLNVLFADGSVQFTSFDVNLETWNSMVHRSDGDVLTR